MKTHKLPLFLGIVSVIWIIMAIYRWWFQYHDVSQLFLAVLLGFIGLAGAYVYNYLKNNDANLINIKEHLNNRCDVLYDEIQEAKKG